MDSVRENCVQRLSFASPTGRAVGFGEQRSPGHGPAQMFHRANAIMTHAARTCDKARFISFAGIQCHDNVIVAR